MRIDRMMQLIEVDLKTDVVPLIIGKTGIGKSEAVQQVADRLGMKLIDLRLGECGEAADAFGLPTITEDKNGNKRTKWTLPTWWPRAEDEQKPHLLFLDEVNRAPDKDTLQTVFKLLLKKQIHETYLPKSWAVVAAINPEDSEDYYVQKMDLALTTRFIHYHVECDHKAWINWAYANNVHKQVIDYIAANPDSLQSIQTSKDGNKSGGRNNPRTWTMLSRVLHELDNQNLFHGMFFEKAQGLLDPGTAAVFKKFVDGNLDRPVRAEEILKNYNPKKKERGVKSAKDRIIEYVKANKYDVLNASMMELINTKIDLSYKVNLKDFILDLPTELGYKLLNDLMTKEDKHAEIFAALIEYDDITKLVNSVDYND